VTIDDGYVSTAEIAAPILAELQVPAVLFVPAGLLGRTAEWLPRPQNEPLVDRAILQSLNSYGIEIGGHGWDHRSMEGLDAADLPRQVVDVRDCLAGLLGTRPRAFAYPYGAFDTSSRHALAEAGWDIAFAIFTDVGEYAVSRVDVNATDTLATMQVKMLPAYRALWRASGHMAPVRRALHRKLGRRVSGGLR
jgi:peptidoglycan/xylan/chitin deacetylase (PgdA/CDA1 family)